MAGNMHLFDEISYLSAAIYALFAAVRAYAIRPYIFTICSLVIRSLSMSLNFVFRRQLSGRIAYALHVSELAK